MTFPRQPQEIAWPVTTQQPWYHFTGLDIDDAVSDAWDAVNRICYAPIWVTHPMRITRIYAVTGVGVTAQLWQAGIYAPNAEGVPATLLRKSLLTIQISTEDVEELTFEEPLVLGPGLYYLALIAGATSLTVGRIGVSAVDGLALAAGVYTEDAAEIGLPDVATPATAGVATPIPMMWILN